MNLEEYGESLRQEVFASAEISARSPLEAFTEYAAERLSASGDIQSSTIAYHYKTGMEVAGWSCEPDDVVLHLFVSIWDPGTELPSLTITEATSSIRRVCNFVTRCVRGYAAALEETDPVWELADLIGRFGSEIRLIRIYLLSNHVARRLMR